MQQPTDRAPWRLGYRPALDGLRGIAVLLVMASHAEFPGFRLGGGTGVTMFFVLSGFLITALLVEEQRDTGGVNLRAFYRRRLFRLLPALVVFLAGALALGWGTGDHAAAALLYVANWVRASGGNLGDLGHTWSLAIEEQFYVVWPLLFVVLARRPAWLLRLAVGGAVLSAVIRTMIVIGGDQAAMDRVYFGSDTRADAILAGCILGLVIAGGRRLSVPRWMAAAAGLALVVVTGIAAGESSFYRWGLTLAAVASTIIVARVAVRPAGSSRVLEWSGLVRTGRLSYGLYLWHWPIMLVASRTMAAGPGRVVVTFALSFLMAVASSRLVEEPMRRFGRHKGRTAVVLERQPVDCLAAAGRGGARPVCPE